MPVFNLVNTCRVEVWRRARPGGAGEAEDGQGGGGQDTRDMLEAPPPPWCVDLRTAMHRRGRQRCCSMVANGGKIEDNNKTTVLLHAATECEGELDGTCDEPREGRRFVAVMAGLPYLKHYDRRTPLFRPPAEWTVFGHCAAADGESRRVGWGWHAACVDNMSTQFHMGGTTSHGR